ncbi:MAG: ABC-F family ATP-binding cassette domain-containing protein [Lachnospiraceae bacterium]|nr:ABC-F family ATP-binding cassette domain-containing protein [Ruminococcus sp.]MCM1275737.1 ABC-F family ATP-binding cassette domain-containing protein [Lachnospiraceae bacterium]
MLLLGLNDIETSFADRTLFSGVSLDVYEGERIGFVGVNGSGKTTLFRLLKGELSPDGGSVHIAGGCRLGFMEQFACRDSDKTLYDEALTVFAELEETEMQLAELNDRVDLGDASAETIARMTELRERFERDGGLTYKSRTAAALGGLGFSESDLKLSTRVLSGGQRSKLQLAKLLLSDADLLLLDEPTNHLDIRSVEWLERFLGDYRGAYIVISHDRYFLDKVTERTIELENRRIRDYKGNYTRFLELKQEDMERRRRVYDGTVKEIKRIEGIIEQQKRWNQAHNYVTIASKRKSIDRLEETLDKPEDAPEAIKFAFRAADGSGNDVLEAKDLALGFGGKTLFTNVNLDVKRGERVFLIGDNGCGKTSLFRVLMGQYNADLGEFKYGARVRVGYFDQAQRGLTESKSALDEVWDAYPKMTETAVRTALAAFLFKGDDVYKLVSELSGGERARVALLKLMLSGANFLLLDEPTNHLDITSREALENALLSYDGTLFVISHDRYLINKLADRIYALTENGVESYLGNYDYYVEKRLQLTANVAAEKPKKSAQALDYKQRKERESERRKLAGKVARLEKRIEELDALINAKAEELSGLSDYQRAMELSEETERLRAEQEAAMEDWERSAAALEEFDV